MTAVDGGRCPTEGCHWTVTVCDCEYAGPDGIHLICAGCGQDADDDSCDCVPDNQPDPDAASYRP